MSGTSRKLMSIKNDKLKSIYSKTNNISDEEVLLLNEPNEADEIFRNLGIPSKKDFVNDTLKDINAINAYGKLFEGKEVFIGSHIKELCNKYFLQILKLNELKGYLPDNAVLEIKKFASEFDKAIVDSSFYILAGRECFKDEYYGKEVKTFIIFFVDPSDSRHTSQFKKNTKTIQITSSGNDWNESRVWLKYLDTERYSNDDMSMFTSNLLINVIPLIVIIISLIISSYPIGFAMIFVLLIVNFFNNKVNNLQSKKYWNERNN